MTRDKTHCAPAARARVYRFVSVFPKRLAAAFAVMLLAAAGGATVGESQSAARKFARIESGRLSAGTRIPFSPGELNSWMRDKAREYAPQGVRNLRIDLATNEATGSANIDFLKLREATTGEQPGWLMKNLFSGERPVRVTARFASQNGRARVDVERVEISGVPIEGRALDFLIDAYVRGTFPDAQVSEWFRLRDRVDHFSVARDGVVVVIGR
jgi:hypothetical protein